MILDHGSKIKAINKIKLKPENIKRKLESISNNTHDI